ncbi:cAMP receptor protein [Tissierella creatinophila DSM 6911]|uniref:cAMP receptor protein n=1 Tax=Tissierella creatinophila DSM 6911 TaxID=1123403 RepID=A0A1U7M6F6_TISCR|nr:cAMP receptor protein [Tissierella creatinophila DSM 6911]
MISIKTCNICNSNCQGFDGVSCIHNIPLLSSLNNNELNDISQGVVTREFKKGEYIFKTGDKADRLYIVCSGKMKIYNSFADGREQIFYIYGSGDFIGAFNLLKEDEYKYNGEALEDTVISTLTKSKFDEIAIKSPTITLKILEKAYERIRHAEDLVDRLSSTNANSKVARLLLKLIQSFGTKEGNSIVLNLSINREEMGSYAGISRETMTRKLIYFSELGLIKLEGNKKIIIKNMDKLKELL